MLMPETSPEKLTSPEATATETIAAKFAAEVREGIADLVPGFLRNRREDVDAIRSAVDRADFDRVRILGHNMKGAGGGYGFDLITQIGASLEAAALQREVPEIQAQCTELARYLDALGVERN